MVAIEKKVPRPGRPGVSKYPWALMQVGDSFLSDMKNINSISSSRLYAQRKTGFVFECRTTPKGVRVWRVK